MRRVNSCNSAISAVLSPRSAVTCRASSIVVIGRGTTRGARSVALITAAALGRVSGVFGQPLFQVAIDPVETLVGERRGDVGPGVARQIE